MPEARHLLSSKQPSQLLFLTQISYQILPAQKVPELPQVHIISLILL